MYEDIERWPTSMRKKKTARWCKGRTGIEHRFKKGVWISWYKITYYIDKCVVCGKHGKMYQGENDKEGSWH